MKNTYRLLFIHVLLILTACSTSYDSELNDNATRLSYTNIEIQLPKMLTLQNTDSYNYVSSDKLLKLLYFSSDGGFTHSKTIADKETKPDAIRAIETQLVTGNDEFVGYTHSDKIQSIYYGKRQDQDGLTMIQYLIENENEEVHERLLGIVKASLETLTLSEAPVDMSEGLVYKIDGIEGMRISSRFSNIATHQFNGMVISTSYLDNTFDYNEHTHINQDSMFDQDVNCDKIMVVKSDVLVVAKQKTKRLLREQKCGSITYKEYLTRVDHGDKKYLLVTMKLPIDSAGLGYADFYNEFLEKLSFIGH